MFVRSDRRMLRIAFNDIIYIESYSDSFTNEEIVISEKSLPISRSYKKEVLALLEQF